MWCPNPNVPDATNKKEHPILMNSFNNSTHIWNRSEDEKIPAPMCPAGPHRICPARDSHTRPNLVAAPYELAFDGTNDHFEALYLHFTLTKCSLPVHERAALGPLGRTGGSTDRWGRRKEGWFLIRRMISYHFAWSKLLPYDFISIVNSVYAYRLKWPQAEHKIRWEWCALPPFYLHPSSQRRLLVGNCARVNLLADHAAFLAAPGPKPCPGPTGLFAFFIYIYSNTGRDCDDDRPTLHYRQRDRFVHWLHLRGKRLSAKICTV